jgi:hypothetical protein
MAHFGTDRPHGNGKGSGVASLFVGLLFLLCAVSNAAPRAAIDQAVKDAGIVRRGETVKYEYSLRNTGDTPLEIVDVQPNCGCTVARYDHEIQAGERGRVEVLLDTSSLDGPVAKSIKVLTNDAANPILMLSAKADIRRLVDVQPDYLRFRHIHGEPPETRVVTVFSPGDPDFKVTAVRSPYAFLKATVREARPEERLEDVSGPQWRLEFTLASDAPLGGLGEHVEIDTNRAEQRRVELPVAGDVRPMLIATPAVLETGSTAPGERRSWVLEVRNLAQTPVDLTGVSSSSANLTASLEAVTAGKLWNLNLELDPAGLKGQFTATVTVRTDSKTQPEVTIPVRGEVVSGK